MKDPAPEATAPRVTPADIEAEIASEHYFTPHDAAIGQHSTEGGPIAVMHPNTHENALRAGAALKLLTICVLVLRNGFTVTGESACASPANFNAETGRRIAREKALEKLWPLLGFRLRDKIAGPYAGVEEYLVAAAESSMSRNNSEELASELLEQIRGGKA